MNTIAAIITIGDELLIGQTIDTNSAWIAQRLNALGIDMQRRVAVGDGRAAITQALDEELARAQIVIVTGGLGPTSDDITKPLLLEYFGGAMRIDEAVQEHVRSLFTKRNLPVMDVNLKQAEVPNSCTVMFNKRGTAPGMWFEKEGRVVVALPGVPFEMMGIMEDEVLPRLRDRYQGGVLLHNSIVTAGIGESMLAAKIEDLEAALPAHIKIAYLPGAGMVKLRLTGRGTNASEIQHELDQHSDAIAQRLGEFVMAMEDVPLEQVVHNWFMQNGKTLGLAESCTGGHISHLITQLPGSSAYFQGAVVCYSEDMKQRLLGVSADTLATEGVVSEAVAAQMATGALTATGAQYSFSVTGLLGPASPDDKEPVGTVCMAVATANEVVSQKRRFHYDRLRNKEMATTAALLMIIKFITGRL